MSDLSLKETDPVLQVYEARAIIVEKDQEIRRLTQEIARHHNENSTENPQELAPKVIKPKEGLSAANAGNNKRLETLELAVKENKNQQELAQTMIKLESELAALKYDKLSDRVEELVANQTRNQEKLSQKVIKLEEELAELKHDHSDRLSTLELSVYQTNQRLEALEVNMNKIGQLVLDSRQRDLAVSNAENIQLKDQLMAFQLSASQSLEALELEQNKIQQELVQKEVVKLKQDLVKELNDQMALQWNSNKETLKSIIHHKAQTVIKCASNAAENVELKEPKVASKSQLCFRIVRIVPQHENKIDKEKNASVLILGGMQEMNAIYVLDSKAQSWKKLSITLPMGIEGFGAVALNEEIYIFGGYSQGFQQHCYKLEINGNWMKLASLNQKRAFISSSSLVCKGDIWAIGGESRDSLKSVERYDISQDKWTYMPEMNYPRSNAAAAELDNKILVAGGRNEVPLKSVEVFDPDLQKWIIFCDLPFELFGHTMLIVNNSILSVFGGKSELDPLKSIWELDLEDVEKQWTEKDSFTYPRYEFGIANLSNGIIIFGGRGNHTETSEIFDGNEWTDGPKLPQKLLNFAYVSISRLLEDSFLDKFL